MFGRKKAQKIKEVLENISQQKGNFENSIGHVEETRVRVHKEICEVMTNTNELTTHAMLNIEEASKAIGDLDAFSQTLADVLEEYNQLKKEVETQRDTVTALVEENKHFTSPAKYLIDVPNTLKQSCQSCEAQLDDMIEYGKRMGVLALNSAIEAGRMGEVGKSFVLTAEEIRESAEAYEKKASTMKAEIEASHAKIAEMEDTIKHLIALIKQNNLGAANLFKRCQETQKFVEKCTMCDFSEELTAVRDKVVCIRNLDEEIAKNAERSKIQLSDIQDDVQNQKNALAEVESDVSHLLDLAEERYR